MDGLIAAALAAGVSLGSVLLRDACLRWALGEAR